jgi:uncharacterized repeat protein (TIGR02543 family)
MKIKTLVSGICLCAALAVLVTACTGEKVTEVPKFTVTFDSTGGSAVPSQTVEPGGLLTRPQWPTKAGYIFDNWYREAEGFGDQAWIFQATELLQADTVNNNLTLYARWFVDKPVTVSFYYSDAEYRAGTPRPPVVDKRTLDFLLLNEYDPPAGANPGFVFRHWYNAADDEKVPVSNIMLEEDAYHFIADWLVSVTVDFETYGGSPVNRVTVGKGWPIYPNNYNTSRGTDFFEGWYTDEGFINRADEELIVDDDMTLYARWFTLADREVFVGVWKAENGKTYFLNSDMTAWYFHQDDAGYYLNAMRWEPMTIASKPFTINEERDKITFDGDEYTKSLEKKTPAGKADLSFRWVWGYPGSDRIGGEMTLKANGTGSLETRDGSVNPQFNRVMDVDYAAVGEPGADGSYVYLLNKDGYVLLTIRYVFDVKPNTWGGSDPTKTFIDDFFREQILVTPGW